MWIYGRKDFTISVMGANIYPEDLEQCIYADKELSKITKSFCQSLSEGENSEVRPAFYFEILIEPNDNLKKHFADSILKNLIEINADLFREGEGPFKFDAGKIKQARILKK